MASPDPYRGVADALVAALQAGNGDAAKEEAALRAAIDAYVAIAEGGDPAEIGLVEYLADEGRSGTPPALERVPGSSESDFSRWRDKLLDLAGF
jgi:hypothetical protein